jgi:protein transport protein SEC13
VIDFSYDYYGKRLATSGSDGSVRVFENNSLLSTISGHSGPVLSLSWAHPKYGNLLATGGSDQKAVIWKENNNKWTVIYEYLGHNGPITSVAWGPYTLGLILGVTSIDGCVSVVVLNADDKWTSTCFHAHDNGTLKLVWSPLAENLCNEVKQSISFATSGADGIVKVWTLDDGEYSNFKLEKHFSWVRALAWDREIFSGSDDGCFVEWKMDQGEWKPRTVAEFKSQVCSISVNEFGGQVAVGLGNGETKVFDRENGWEIVCALDENGYLKDSS